MAWPVAASSLWRRAARRLSWRRSAARLEGAPDDLDRPASRGRAHPLGARIREHVACPLAPPVGPATTRRLLAIRITRRRSIEPGKSASIAVRYSPRDQAMAQPARLPFSPPGLALQMAG